MVCISGATTDDVDSDYEYASDSQQHQQQQQQNSLTGSNVDERSAHDEISDGML